MENITNIKYKKKYHKYKNKYYKLVQNHKLKGGSQAYSIIAVILTIIGILGLGSLLYKNNDKLKNWFDKNAELLKKRIKYFTNKDKYIQNKKKQDEEEEKKLGFLASLNSFNPFSSNNNSSKSDSNKNDSDTSGESISAGVPEGSGNVSEDIPVGVSEGQSEVSVAFPKDDPKNPKDPIINPEGDSEDPKEDPKDPIVNPEGDSEDPIIVLEDSGVVPEDSIEGFIFKNPGKTSIIIELQKILYIIRYKYTKNNSYKEDIILDIIKNNGGIWYKKDKPLDLDEVHWNIDEKHFYWSNNPNNNDVIIKYYNRFDDEQNISVYKLNNNNSVWELQEGYIFESESANELPETYTKPQENPPPHHTFNKTINNSDELKQYLTNIGLEFLYSNNINDEAIVNDFINYMNSLTDGNYIEKYTNYLNKIIEEKIENLNIKLTTQSISGDGLCQFYSIIHQLQGKTQKELEELLNKYNDNYKLFDDSELTEKIQNFINKIIIQKTNNPENKYNGNFKNEELANKLKEIIRTFITKHYSNNILYCNHIDKQAAEEIITYQDTVKIYFDENNGDSINQFIEYYNNDKKNWGDDFTLTIIAAIFDLKINLYEKRNRMYTKTIRNSPYLNDKKECDNQVEISLLYSGRNHYESVIKI